MFLRITLTALVFLPLVANAQQTTPLEFPWTLVASPDLEKFEVKVGDLRINNIALERASRKAPAGAATVHEFSASIANRSKADLHVLVQVIGLKQDKTPTLSSEGNIDVENKHTETVRSFAAFSQQAISETAFYYIRVLATPPD